MKAPRAMSTKTSGFAPKRNKIAYSERKDRIARKGSYRRISRALATVRRLNSKSAMAPVRARGQRVSYRTMAEHIGRSWALEIVRRYRSVMVILTVPWAIIRSPLRVFGHCIPAPLHRMPGSAKQVQAYGICVGYWRLD
jgi:hypothetical protein